MRKRLLDRLQIRQEPRGLLGRYFLKVEQDLADIGLEARLMPLEALVEHYLSDQSSWNGLAPMLDTRYSDVRPEDGASQLVYDRNGKVVGANACRLIDIGNKSLKEACEDLTFFYGANAAEMRGKHRCVITAPAAYQMRGKLSYMGGFWVHPDHRGTGVGQLVQGLCRFHGLSQWQFDYELTVAAAPWRRPELQKRYHFARYEDSLTFYVENDLAVMNNGVLASSPRQHLLAELARQVNEADQLRPVDRDEQRVGTG